MVDVTLNLEAKDVTSKNTSGKVNIRKQHVYGELLDPKSTDFQGKKEKAEREIKYGFKIVNTFIRKHVKIMQNGTNVVDTIADSKLPIYLGMAIEKGLFDGKK